MPLSSDPILVAVASDGFLGEGRQSLDCAPGQMADLGIMHHSAGRSIEVRDPLQFVSPAIDLQRSTLGLLIVLSFFFFLVDGR